MKTLNFKRKDDFLTFPERGHKRAKAGSKGRGKPKRPGGRRWRQGRQRNWQKKNAKRNNGRGRKVGIAHIPEQPNELSREIYACGIFSISQD